MAVSMLGPFSPESFLDQPLPRELLESQTFPNQMSALFLPNVFLGFFYFPFFSPPPPSSNRMVWNNAKENYSFEYQKFKSALIFTEQIVSITESETLVRSEGVVGNWPAMEYKELTILLV